MAYLKREARREDILKVAVRLLEKEGLAALTVRRVASEAGIAVGLIHCHFDSANALRAEAFVCIARASLVVSDLKRQKMNARQQLLEMLCSDEEAVYMIVKLWNEAVYLAEKDDLLKAVYFQSMREWHAATTAIIRAGQRQKIFRRANASDVAWRLIGLSCGLTGIYYLEDKATALRQARRLIRTAIENELAVRGR